MGTNKVPIQQVCATTNKKDIKLTKTTHLSTLGVLQKLDEPSPTATTGSPTGQGTTETLRSMTTTKADPRVTTTSTVPREDSRKTTDTQGSLQDPDPVLDAGLVESWEEWGVEPEGTVVGNEGEDDELLEVLADLFREQEGATDAGDVIWDTPSTSRVTGGGDSDPWDQCRRTIY